MINWRSLPVRLGGFFAVVITVTLLLFSASIYTVAQLTEDDEDDEYEYTERELAEEREHLLTTIAIALPASLAVAIGGGFILARRALKSLETVIRIAEHTSVENLGERIPEFRGAGEEVERLVAASNAMLDRIERAVSGLRRFTADAAHELRTPLAVLMGRLELSLRRPRDVEELRGTIETTLEELERLTRLVEVLLTLARSDAGDIAVSEVPVHVETFLEQVTSPYEAVAAERGLRLCLLSTAPPELVVRIDPLLLGRVLANLLDNACKFTPGGGDVELRTSYGPRGLCIVVSDSGPGLPEHERARIFERFFRSPSVRGSIEGFGLGLPLAQDLTRAMGGELTLLPTPVGAAFVVELPARPEGDTLPLPLEIHPERTLPPWDGQTTPHRTAQAAV
jgi:two-component system OmpR family sensor kinase